MYDYPRSRYGAAPTESEVFAGLALLSLCMPLLHAVGSWYLNQREAT